MLPVADHPLSDSEIEATFGPLFAEALQAFRTQPEYLVVMVEQNAETMRRRAVLRAERERKATEREAKKAADRIEAIERRNARDRERRRQVRKQRADQNPETVAT